VIFDGFVCLQDEKFFFNWQLLVERTVLPLLSFSEALN